MAFELIEILNGLLSLFFVLISLIVSINIIKKYFKLKNTTYLYMGLSWIGITSPWWGSTISFFTYLLIGKGLELQLYLIVTLPFIPIFFTFYTKAITDLLGKEYQVFLIVCYTIVGILFEIFYIYLTLFNPASIGLLEHETDIRYLNFVTLYLILIIFSLLIFGVFFGKASLRSKNPDVKAQGKFLIIAFASFTVGALLDSIIPLNPITLPITRGILISSSLAFYCGFILPNWLKNVLQNH
ncbi:MAG: hypothetical protein EU547_07910 [Promethearchaeota archaeon]|nr:MAG: hypothetical protein EU547_07910 [Candidatus Lokiarchaeota archaeon]